MKCLVSRTTPIGYIDSKWHINKLKSSDRETLKPLYLCTSLNQICVAVVLSFSCTIVSPKSVIISYESFLRRLFSSWQILYGMYDNLKIFKVIIARCKMHVMPIVSSNMCLISITEDPCLHVIIRFLVESVKCDII